MLVGNGNELAASGFQANQSSTWTTVGEHQPTTQSYLGLASDGSYGLDTVGLGVEAATGLTQGAQFSTVQNRTDGPD